MKVSIITVCKNAENTIENSINTVINQTYQDIEYIIIDGNSSDNTVPIIKKFKDKIAYFISAPDSGIYNAMNKGIKVATGDILFFLNSNDYLYDEKVIEDVVNKFKKTNAKIVFGNIEFIDKNGEIKEIRDYSTVDKLFLTAECICHQCIFYKKEVFENCGLYDEGFKITADYNLNLKAIMEYNFKTIYFNRIISKFTLGGFSNSDSEEYKALCTKEKEILLKKYFKPYHFESDKILNKTFRSIARNARLRKIAGKLLGFSL